MKNYRKFNKAKRLTMVASGFATWTGYYIQNGTMIPYDPYRDCPAPSK